MAVHEVLLSFKPGVVLVTLGYARRSIVEVNVLRWTAALVVRHLRHLSCGIAACPVFRTKEAEQ